MFSKDWKDVSLRFWPKIRELRKVFKNYSYSDPSHIYSTDEKICEFLLEKMRSIKWKIFEILELAYERRLDAFISILDNTRIEIDIFLDEIKVRQLSCKKDITMDTLENIIKHDFDIVTEIRELQKSSEELFDMCLKLEPIERSWNQDEFQKFEEKIKDVLYLEQKIRRIFEERDKLINLKKLHLKDVIEEIINKE